MLIDFQDLFKGQRGQYNGEPIELELLPGSKPFYAKPFSIPKAFIIPKKNKTVRVITDFRGLNKCLKHNPFPMPKIPDIFRGMEKFRYATTIDRGAFINTIRYPWESRRQPISSSSV